MNWPFTFYPATLKGNALGTSKFFFIWVLASLKDNVAVHKHELTHVKQWFWVTLAAVAVWFVLCAYVPELRGYTSLGVFAVFLDQVLYNHAPAYRQWAEVQAYRVQVQHGGDLLSCATSLSQDYGLHITQDEALQLLKD